MGCPAGGGYRAWEERGEQKVGSGGRGERDRMIYETCRMIHVLWTVGLSADGVATLRIGITRFLALLVKKNDILFLPQI